MPDDWGQIYDDAGQQYGLDPNLLRSLVTVESSGNPKAVSPKGATGLAQLMPATAAALGVTDPTDPAQAIPAAARLLRENYDRYGDPSLAIAAYHGGTDPNNWGPKTRDYIGKVQDAYQRFQEAQAAQPVQPPATAGATGVPQDTSGGALPDKVKAALAAGYSNAEVMEYLRNDPAFVSQANAARKAGYKDDEIYGYLGLKSEAPKPAAAPTDQHGASGAWDQQPTPGLMDRAGNWVTNQARIAEHTFTNAAVGTAGEALQGLPRITAAANDLSPYYGVYEKWPQMDAASRDAALQKIAGDPWLSIDAKDRLQASLGARDNGQSPVPLGQFSDPYASHPEQSPGYQIGTKVRQFAEKNLPATEAEKQSLTGQIAGGLGAMPAAIAASAATMSPIGGAMVFGTQQAQEEYEKAKAAGATDEQANKASLKGAAVGTAAGAVDVGMFLKPVERTAPGFAPWLAAKAQKAVEQGLVFPTVGETQQWLTAQIDKDFDPKSQYAFDLKRLVGEVGSGLLLGGIHGTHMAEAPVVDPTGPTNLSGETKVNGQTAPQTPLGTQPDAVQPITPPARPAAPASDTKSATAGPSKAQPVIDYAQQHLAAMMPEPQRVTPEQVAQQTNLPPDAAAVVAEHHNASVDANAEIAKAVAQVNPAPSEAQAEAGNYKKASVSVQGIPITIETPKGVPRTGVGPDGEPWVNVHPTANYGYIKGTEGADGDHVDTYVGPYPNSKRAFVVDQIDPATGAFDEHKSILGARTPQEAMAIYDAGFSDGSGPSRRAAVTEMPIQQFKEWVKNGDTKSPLQSIGPERSAEGAVPGATDAGRAQGAERSGEAVAQPAAEQTAAAPEARPEPKVTPQVPVSADELYAMTHQPLGSGTTAHPDEAAPAAEGSGLQVPHETAPSLTYAEATHTKTGEPLHVARLDGDKLPPEQFKALVGAAKTLGGYYSSFRGKGAVPGFQFKDKAKAEQFIREQGRGRGVAQRVPAASEWRPIGNNSDGHAIYQDANGVRSIVKNGIRETEPALLVATRQGVRTIARTDATRDDEYKLAPKSETAAYGANNKVFTKSAADAARERLRAKLKTQLNSGFDPEMALDGLTLAGYHIEAGARKFSDFAKAMVDDLGQNVVPYLRGWYENVRHHPGLDTAGMSTPDEIERELQNVATNPTLGAEETGHGIQGTIPVRHEGSGTEDVHATPQGGEDGSAPPGEEHGGARPSGSDSGIRTEGAERPATESGGVAPRGGNRPGDTDRVSDAGRPAEPRAARRPAEARQPDSGVQGENYHIPPDSIEEGRGPKLKARDNLAAIELTKRLLQEDRPATKEEQAVLAKYVGWGGLSGAFENSTGAYGKGFEEIGARLKSLLTKDEYKTAARSTQYAHYTAEHVIRSMWNAVRDMGFKGGSVFEPGMGIGHFAGMMPEDLAAESHYHGIELDHLTASIAKLLYPKSGVRQADFTRTPMPEGSFDLVIGNPPFSDTVVKSDPKYAARGFMLHDYFFAKSLDSVRPGGLLAFITSAGTMNKMDDAARRYMAERSEFLGGVRLPSTAFKKNAGTEVTTDILFFRRRPEGRIDLGDAAPIWTETAPRTLPDADGNPAQGNVSRYFSDHPEQVLGREGFFDKLYKGRYAVHENEGADLQSDLRQALDRLPKDVMSPPLSPEQKAELDFASGQKKEGSFYISPDGRLMQYSDGAGREVAKRGAGAAGGKTASDHIIIRHLIPVRDALRDVFKADLARDDAAGNAARAALNQHYDNFVKQHGPINKAEFQYRRPTIIQQESARLEAREEARSAGEHFDDGGFNPELMLSRNASISEIAKARQRAREQGGDAFSEGSFDPSEMQDIVIEKRPNIAPFMDDPESYRLRSIEQYNDQTGASQKKDIFHRNILTHEAEPELRSANDGVLWSLNKFGKLDVDAIADKMGKDRSAIVSELGDSIFQVPYSGGTHQTADHYLSGDVLSKLDTARAAADQNPEFRRNVTALEGVIPAPLSPAEINMTIGMPWIPVDYIQDFLQEHMKIGRPGIAHSDATGKWVVDNKNIGWGADRSGVPVWSTDRMDAYELVDHALNRLPPRVVDRIKNSDGTTSTVFNEVATQAAQDRVNAIKDEFQNWLKERPDTADHMASLYNEKYNRVVLRNYDGSYLTTPGIASDWRWRPHQTRVISRIISDGNTYMAHAVGAGKTSAAIGAGMEMRRLGLVKKPMYVVPNHMLGQFTKEFYEQYPTARIAVADDRNFHTDRRRQFISNIAQDDLDAVIITHSSFGKVPVSQEFQSGLVGEQLELLRKSLNGLDKNDRITRKNIENLIEKFEQKLSKTKEGQDLTNTWEELGIDFMFIDEAHGFRKLTFGTQQANLKGITPLGSEMAWDLYTKMRQLDAMNPGRSAVLMSGTPVTNTMGELYTISRYLQRQTLEAAGLSHFDSWAQTYGDTKTELEPQPDGGYKPVTRFSKFVNMPELYKMVGQIMDVVTPSQLEQYVVRPQLKGGERQLHIAPFTDALAGYQGELAARMQAIAARKGPPAKGDDILLSVINDGRHAAIDPRFVEAAQNDPNSKLNMMIDNVARIWADTRSQQFFDPRDGYQTKTFKGPATQMIFSNLGINGRGPMGFSGYQWMKSALMRKGIPASEIAFIGDYKGHIARQALFNDVNEGKVRILIGSTQKMGTGVNAQKRLYALHNLDPLWYPSDDEQRVGRILRQGNMNPEIDVHDYTTQDTYDRTMWGMMGRKGRFIEQFFRGDPNLRDMEDLGEAGMYEQAAAMATSDNRVMQLTEMKQELDKAIRRRDAFDRESFGLRQRFRQANEDADRHNQSIARIGKDIERRVDTSGDAFNATIGGQKFATRKDAADAINREFNRLFGGLGRDKSAPVGEIGGFPLLLRRTVFDKPEFFLAGNDGGQIVLSSGDHGEGASVIRSAEIRLRNLDDEHQARIQARDQAQQTANDIRPLLGRQFQGGDEIDRLRAGVQDLEAQLKPAEKSSGVAEDAGAFGAIQESQAENPRGGNSAPQGVHEEAAHYVRETGRKTGFEHIAAVDKTGQIFHTATDNSTDSASFGGLLPYMEARDAGIIVHHNHPSSRQLSTSDIASLAYPGLSHIVEHGHDGTMSAAALSDAVRESGISGDNLASLLTSARILASDKITPMGWNLIRDGVVTRDEMNRIYGEAVNRALHQANLIDYISSHDFPDTEWARSLVDSATTDVAGLARRYSIAQDADRYADTVRYDEGMAGLPGGHAKGTASEAARGFTSHRDSAAGNRGRLAEEPEAFTADGSPKDRERARSLTDRLLDPIRRFASSDEAQKVLNGETMNAARQHLGEIRDDIMMKTNSLSLGTDAAKAAAKDFANEDRRISHHLSTLDKMIQKKWSPEERREMGKALDEQSVMDQELQKPYIDRNRAERDDILSNPDIESKERAAALAANTREYGRIRAMHAPLDPARGLGRLPEDQRALTTMLDGMTQRAWKDMVESGIVSGKGLPHYMPRYFVNVVNGKATRFKGKNGVATIDPLGRNLTTAGPGRRHYLTPEETERAARLKLGDNAMLVTDIRALLVSLQKSQKAIAGKELIRAIKEIGRKAGAETVTDEAKTGFFTMPHPAFEEVVPAFKTDDEGKVVPRLDEDGRPIMTRKPIYVSREFEGPLRAVLETPSGAIYNALMALKGKTMGIIMYSPLIHNAVEWGRALPAMPGKVLTFRVYFDGYRAKNDPATMDEAISAGLTPIGVHGGLQDITGMAEGVNVTPGRSWTAQLLAAIPGLFDPRAGDAVKLWVDKAGDFWHNTLLWDRVADLQMGLYVNLRDQQIASGMDPLTAQRFAAHFANRYAGALPKEAMSTAARKIANLVLFSRSFTLGNLGAMKDMVAGLPSEVRAQILRDSGTKALEQVQGVAKRKAIATIALDIGLMYVGNALLQSAIAVLSGDNSLDEEGQGYARRMGALLQRGKENPLDVMNPFKDISSLTPQGENEPNKQDRILAGYASDGTGIYMRNPVGKIGEEFSGWLTQPLSMFSRKEGTLLRPTMQVLANDKGFGHKVYDPYADTPVAWVKNIGRIVGLYLGDQIPLQSFQAANDALHGRGDPLVNAAQVLGPLAGVTFSKGAPGGPAVGQMYAAEDQHKFQVEQAMPDIRRKIVDGNVSGVVVDMNRLGIPQGLQKYYLRTTQNPRSRLSAKAMKDFSGYATPEQMEEMNRALH